jgi:hypothetical protein
MHSPGKVELPWFQINIQTGIPHLVVATIIALLRQHIVEAPLLSPKHIPGYLDTRLGGTLLEIYDDKAALIILHPALRE